MFPCNQCGACCRQIEKIPFAVDMKLPDGSCKYLDHESNLCTIYKSRPIFCRVDDYYDQFLTDKISREDFYRQNLDACEELRKNL
ncbi:MAG: YkgJ family cysteine cluster protein [Selenomonadaceae bacterium]|nr:YkgJ family cysteine cluster protein [Selenomonadaceae bacterium]